jgi:hypothetical protein
MEQQHEMNFQHSVNDAATNATVVDAKTALTDDVEKEPPAATTEIIDDGEEEPAVTTEITIVESSTDPEVLRAMQEKIEAMNTMFDETVRAEQERQAILETHPPEDPHPGVFGFSDRSVIVDRREGLVLASQNRNVLPTLWTNEGWRTVQAPQPMAVFTGTPCVLRRIRFADGNFLEGTQSVSLRVLPGGNAVRLQDIKPGMRILRGRVPLTWNSESDLVSVDGTTVNDITSFENTEVVVEKVGWTHPECTVFNFGDTIPGKNVHSVAVSGVMAEIFPQPPSIEHLQ